MKILITDGENRSSLAATRSLGRQGYHVIVTGKSPFNIASSSRYCAKSYRLANPLIDKRKFTSDILTLASQEKIDIILPMSDSSIYNLNSIRSELPRGVILGCPDCSKMAAVSDKYSLFKLAESLNIPIPQTQYLSSADDLKKVINNLKTFPVVIKPSLSRVSSGNGYITTSVRYAYSKAELEKLYENYGVLKYPSLIQEKIIGPGTGLFTLYDSIKPIALFSHRRLMEKPPSGGISVLSESVSIDRQMLENAQKLLTAVGWNGVAMVEFKRDVKDGIAKLMEINGRFWGTLQLSISCGMDFPVLYLNYLKGGKRLSCLDQYSVGCKMRWFFGTLDHLIIKLCYSDPAKRTYSHLKAFKEFLGLWKTRPIYDVFDRKDPVPFLVEAICYIAQAARVPV